jgi:uncharacterized protein (TIGR02328 family)
MRLWHQFLIPYLDRQRLLGAHRELCALRGKGWGRKHATVDYVFTHRPEWLVAYHHLIMDEMKRRGYNPDPKWESPEYRGTTLGYDAKFADADIVDDQYVYAKYKGGTIYPEHDPDYLEECIGLLKEKQANCDWESIDKYKRLYL